MEPQPYTPPALIRLAGQDFSDGHGTVLLRGTNARVEGLFDVTFDDGRLPLEPIPPFGAEDCHTMAEVLGWNLLRLPVNWSAIEPERGRYDLDYIGDVRALVERCAEHGVFTLVDLHQDAYSKEIGEDGAPLWAIVPPPETLLGGPLTDLTERRTSLQVLRAFSSFFDDAETLQDAYAAMAARLGEELTGTPGFLGLELMNEPVAWNDEKLHAFHDKVGAAVAASMPDAFIAFEPDALRNLNDHDPVLFPTTVPRAVYAPHHYTGVFTAEPGTWPDLAAVRQSALDARAEGDLHGGPTLIGEFGHDPREDAGRAWLTAALDAYDEALLNSAFWVWEEWSQGGWGLFDRAGSEEEPGRGPMRSVALDAIARPFPRSVPGALRAVRWLHPTLSFSWDDPVPEWPWVTVSLPGHLGAFDRWRALCDGEERTLEAIGPGAALFDCAGTSAELTLSD